jgi:hypothetical protein
MLLIKSTISRAVLKFGFSLVVCLPLLLESDWQLTLNATKRSRRVGGRQVWRRLRETVGQGLEVLDDGGEVELVASTAEATQAHPLEAMLNLQVGNAHLHFLALIARPFKFGRAG